MSFNINNFVVYSIISLVVMFVARAVQAFTGSWGWAYGVCFSGGYITHLFGIEFVETK